jgi:hypothetical protein
MVTLMLEHPGWRRWERGAERVMCCGTTLWRLTWHAGAKEVTAVPAGGPPGGQPVVDRIDARPHARGGAGVSLRPSPPEIVG